MKLTALLLMVAFFHVSASSFGQKITLKVKDTPLEKVIKDIRKQSSYPFFYNDEDIENRKVTVMIQNASLEEALTACFKDLPLTYKIIGHDVIITQKQASPTILGLPPVKQTQVVIDISGKITNEQGEPVVATVRVKGSTNAVSSNEQGLFTIKSVEDDATLEISGMTIETTEWKVDKKKYLAISVKTKSGKLNDVTVTAYGIVRRDKEIGYSVSKVSGDEITRANTGNLLTGLVGKVSGLNISSQSSEMNPQMRILLRGIRSFSQNTNTQPLFIFNGAPLSFGNDQNGASQVAEFINNFNPADIEDVTILKGANGTALYGPEGVNGVIIITTKKGAKGVPVINFRNNSSVQFVDWRQYRRQTEYGLGSGPVDQFGNGIYDQYAGSYTWGPKYDGRMVPIGYPDENGELQKVSYTNKNDYRRFFNLARNNRTTLSFSQGDLNSSYYLGLGYQDQTGLLPGDKQNQINLIQSANKKFSNLFNIQTNIAYSRSNQDRGPDNITPVVLNTPTFIPLLDYKDWQNGYWANRSRYWSGISPYESIATDRTKITTNALNVGVILNIKPLAWLTIKEQPSLNYSGINQKQIVNVPKPFMDFVTDPSKLFTNTLGSVAEQLRTNTSLNNDLLLSTVHKAGDFLIRTNLGNTIRHTYYKDVRAGAQLELPVYDLAFGGSRITAGGTEITTRQFSLFGTTNIGYRDMVFLELTGRNEWDSKRAPSARGEDFYASANASVVLKDLIPLLKNQHWLSNLRLRASVSQTANLPIVPQQAQVTLGLSGQYPYITPDGKALYGYQYYGDNPNLLIKPEKVISQEYGLNSSLFDNRVSFDLTYYFQVNNGVILPVVNSFLSGYPSIDNAGKFQNQGFEFDLGINPLIKLPKDFNISLQLRGALNSNKVLAVTPIYNGLFPVSDPNGFKYYAVTGKSAYQFAPTDWKRDPQGRVVVDKNSGLPIVGDYGTYVLKGNTLPRYTLSANLGFSYKRFSFYVLADYAGGYDHQFQTADFYSGADPRTTYNNRQPFVFPNSVYVDGNGQYVENTNILTKTGGVELYQQYGQVGLYGLINAASIKIREVSFQYTLPLSKALVKELNFGVYARDLFSFYPKSNIYGDPSLIAGPGYRGNALLNGVNNLNNTIDPIGGSSSNSRLPGTVLLGFNLSATF